MHPTANRFLLASIGIAALGIAAFASVGSYAQPQTSQAANVSTWVQSTPDRALVLCPMTAAAGTPDAPFFAFATTLTSCLLDGPYVFNGNKWYVQRIKGASAALNDIIRVCTAAAVDPNRTSHFTGPCHTRNGAGPRGCEVCTVAGVPQ